MTRRVLAWATRPRSGRDSCSAGQTPNRSAVAIASPVLNSRTGTFISITDSAANELVGIQATISARPRHAINTPSTAPATGDHHRLGQELLDDADPPRAERGADGELLLPVRAANQQQDRDVGAADEQQRRDRAQQQEEPRPHRPGIHLDDAAQVDAELIGIARRRLGGELLEDRLQLGVGLRGGDAGPDLQGGAVIDVGLCPDLERHVDIRFAPAEPRRHHADDLIVLAHELNRPPDHRRIAGVVALPELIAEHDDADRILPRRRIGGDQPAPEHRRRAPVIGRVGRDVGGDDVFGDIAVGGGEIPAVLPDDAFDGARLPQLIELQRRSCPDSGSGPPCP